MKRMREVKKTPLAVFVGERLTEMGMKQAEFCRLTRFDQGLLSRILSSQVTHISLESALKLTNGLEVSPTAILTLIGRDDWHDLIMSLYVAGEPKPALDVQQNATANDLASDGPAPRKLIARSEAK